jgi:hypothetical protein
MLTVRPRRSAVGYSPDDAPPLGPGARRCKRAEPNARSAALFDNAIKEIDMFGKILGGIVGAKAADHVSGVGGTGGALLGVGAAALAKRLGPVGLIAALAGGYAFKRYRDRKAKPAEAQPKTRPSAT